MTARRVLLVVRSDGIGGAERSVANLILTLDQHGIAWDLVALRVPRDGPGFLAPHGPVVIDRAGPTMPVRRLRQLRWLRRRLREQSYDAMFGFGPSPNAVVALARRRAGPATIVCELGDPYIARRRWWNRLVMWTYRRADVAVVQTHLAAAELRRDWRRPPVVTVIPNSLAVDALHVDRSAPREPVIAAVGRLAPVKRFEDAIEAFARLGSAGVGWRMVIVGDGDERARLENLVDERLLAGRVRFLGMHQAPWEVLAASDIFVLSSAHEGFPNAMLEAMASGCAVVSSDCRYGPREIIDDGVNGVLYPVGDVEALAARLSELIADPDRREALARAGSETAAAHTLDAVAPAWVELIRAGRTYGSTVGSAP